MVRALTFHQCGPGSITGSDVICGLRLLVLYSAPRGFSPGTPVFPSHKKPTFDSVDVDLCWFDLLSPQLVEPLCSPRYIWEIKWRWWWWWLWHHVVWNGKTKCTSYKGLLDKVSETRNLLLHFADCTCRLCSLILFNSFFPFGWNTWRMAYQQWQTKCVNQWVKRILHWIQHDCTNRSRKRLHVTENF